MNKTDLNFIKSEFRAFSYADRVALIRYLRDPSTSGDQSDQTLLSSESGILSWYNELPRSDAKALFAALCRVDFKDVTNDAYGNSRKVVSWLSIAMPDETFADVLARYKDVAKRYRGKDFGGGLVFKAVDEYHLVNLILFKF